MLNRRRFLQQFMGSTTALLLTQGCTAPRMTPAATPHSGATHFAPEATLRVGFTGAVKQMNPAFYSVLEEYQLGFALYDGLVWVDESLIPQPLLANTWETSSNLLQWTFMLEQGVTFHHGAPLTTADVVYTFSQLLDPKVGSPFRSVFRFVQRVEALDAYTVRFHLETPNADLPLLLGSPQASIIPHDYARRLLNTHPSGTGPFRFVDLVPHERILLVRNDDYWAMEEAYVAQLEYLYLPYTEQLQALRTEKLDVISQVATDDIPSLQADPTMQVVVAQSGNYQTIVMQATEAPFTDLRVRQALKYCADHVVLHEQVLQGRGLLGNNHPVASINPFWQELPAHKQDIAQAKALLAQAGYPKGLRLDLITSTSRPGMVELALAFREMASLAGVDIRVISVPADVYWSDYSGKTPFHIGNWGFRPSIDETLMIAYHSTATANESNWRNPTLDNLIDRARAEADVAVRKMLYAQIQQLIGQEGAVIVPYFKPVAIALRHTIEGFILHPAGWLDFSTVRVIVE